MSVYRTIGPLVYVLPMTPPGRGRVDPRGTVCRINKEDHYTLLHTKYEKVQVGKDQESSGPCAFGEEDFLKFLS